MTPLNKVVRRRSEEYVTDRRKLRRLIVSLHPGGVIGLRLEKCRREEFIPMRLAYELAIKLRVQKQRDERRKARGLPPPKFLAKRGRL